MKKYIGIICATFICAWSAFAGLITDSVTSGGTVISDGTVQLQTLDYGFDVPVFPTDLDWYAEAMSGSNVLDTLSYDSASKTLTVTVTLGSTACDITCHTREFTNTLITTPFATYYASAMIHLPATGSPVVSGYLWMDGTPDYTESVAIQGEGFITASDELTPSDVSWLTEDELDRLNRVSLTYLFQITDGVIGEQYTFAVSNIFYQAYRSEVFDPADFATSDSATFTGSVPTHNGTALALVTDLPDVSALSLAIDSNTASIAALDPAAVIKPFGTDWRIAVDGDYLKVQHYQSNTWADATAFTAP